MPKFVQIDNDVVTAHLEASRMPIKVPEGRRFVEVDDFPELLSTCVDGVFTPPAPSLDYGRQVMPRAFLQLFTAAEFKAIRNATKVDDDVAYWYELTVGVQEPIRLKHPTTISGLDFLVSKGLLTAARRDAIIAG